MRAREWFRLSSLRATLSAAGLAGLLTTTALTGLLLLTAWTASTVVRTAQSAHQRVRVYSQLQTAARAYQGASYNSVRDPRAEMLAAAAATRRELERRLREAARLPIMNERDRIIAHRIARQGRTVLEHFRDTRRIVRQVDSVWRERGSQAALREVNRLSTPIQALDVTLRDEVNRGDTALAKSAERGLTLIGLSVACSLICLLLALTFSLIVQALLHRRLRPGLVQLERGAQAFGQGQLDHRINLAGSDELARLSAAFDRMAEIVADRDRDRHEIQLGLESVVAERTEALQRANAELSSADERRRAFMADVSHELRTPLTIIRGEAQVALRTVEQPDFDAPEVFERILQQTLDLSRMVDDLFLIARAEAGGLPLNRKLLDLRDLADRVASDFETLAQQGGSSIQVTRGRGTLAFVDADRARRALTSLLENALRHCQPGVNVQISVYEDGPSAVISVDDDGPGINPAVSQQLFQRFRRGETRGEGSGLGLSLVSALVEAHGGCAALEPRPSGGTRAIMRFPRAKSAQAAA